MQQFVFTVEQSDQIGKGQMGFNMPMVLNLISFLKKSIFFDI